MIGKISDRDEFFYPDTELGNLDDSIYTFMPKNSKKGIQLAFELSSKTAKVEVEISGVDVEYYQMKAIPVEYNTGDGVSQGGDMVVSKWEKHMAEYTTRKAPFYVYDCLIPREDGFMTEDEGKVFAYICFVADKDTVAGEKNGKIKILDGENEFVIDLKLKVYDVSIDMDDFFVTNWFSLDAIKEFHGEDAFMEMLAKYAKAMKRTHQTSFYLELDDTCIKDKEKYVFDFEYLTPIIKTFKDAGIKTLEIGKILNRGFKADGMPDMYTDTFRCERYRDIDFDTELGQEISEKYMKTLADYLKEYSWDEDVLFHIHDEPDVHFKSESALKNRIRQYTKAREIVLKHLPKAKIIEAVGTEKFMDVIDVLVPVTSTYEAHKEGFDQAADSGKELWNYVCCTPSGKWLNRFLDFAVIKSRILFWGFAKNGVNGFLHWGFNYFAPGMNPYVATSCHNPTGIGTNYPCGDAFIVYPGEGDVNLSLRLEAQRIGAEDASLFRKLMIKNPQRSNELISKVFISNNTYNDDIDNFSEVYETLLKEMELAGL